MFKGSKNTFTYFLCIATALSLFSSSVFASRDTELITDFNSLMTAVQNANDGDTLLVGDIDFSPLSPDVPNSMMCITVEKSITVKSGKSNGAAIFLNGGFALSGSKLNGEKISVQFENIVFDGKADQASLSEKDYEHPWNEAEQVETYNASLKAQQALSFTGNVNADFSNCVFRNYMHEYGPVIDIRYADYTGNEYINLPDYSGCSINLNFDRCRIEKNSALYDGGAIYIEANKNVVLNAKNCVFSNNISTNGQFSRGGGAVYADGATLQFTDCTLEKNISNHVFDDTVLPEYDTHRGGALLLQSATLKMVNTSVIENRSSMGGAISFTNSGAEIEGCRFIENRAEAQTTNPDGMLGPWSNMSQGGAIYIEGNSNDTVTFINCDVKNNSAVNAYGGIYGYYVPFEDPSLPTYNIKMILCTYEGNKNDIDYDYSTVGDLLWVSHPGDMFANPHLTMFGCYITDETFEKDFPHKNAPTADNGYNYLAPTANEEIRNLSIPVDDVEKMIGDIYADKLDTFHVGSNYSESLYGDNEPPVTSDTESSANTDTLTESGSPETDNTVSAAEQQDSPMIWIILSASVVIIAGSVITITLITFKNKARSKKEPEPIVKAETKIIMTRYEDPDIDRFISLVPETQLLTSRELEVLREMLRGKKQSEVAYYLGIEVSTVKDFYKKIYDKLGVENKNALFVKASEILKSK